jgi:hypothetical protein
MYSLFHTFTNLAMFISKLLKNEYFTELLLIFFDKLLFFFFFFLMKYTLTQELFAR